MKQDVSKSLPTPAPVDAAQVPSGNTDFPVEDFEIEEVPWFRKAFQPGFLLSFGLHGLLVIVAALILLPGPTKKITQLEGALASEPVKFAPIDLAPLEFEKIANDFANDELESEFEFEDKFDEQAFENNAPTLFKQIETKTTDSGLEWLGQDRATMGAPERLNENDTEVPAAVARIQGKVAEAGGKKGEVQFSLVWESKSDLDLHVINPKGGRIFYQNKIGNFGGELDVDRNATNAPLTKSPVENVRWLDGDPVSGRYTVWIHLFRPRGEASVEFELMGKTGDNIEVQNADVEPGNEIAIFRFYFFAGNVSDQDRAKRLADLKLLQAREEEAATKLLNAARGKQVDAQLYAIAVQYPHTDAAVEALKRMTGNTQK